MTERRVKLLFRLECKAPEDADINEICDFIEACVETSGSNRGPSYPLLLLTSVKVSLDQ